MRIMVPLDGSRFGEHALPCALSIARARSATLDLVHVHTVVPLTYLEGVPQLDASVEMEQLEADRSYLSRARARVEAAGMRATSNLLDGPTIMALRDHAEKSGATLIVMSTHGRGPMSRAWLGSIADGLARHSPVPVLLLRPSEDDEMQAEFGMLDNAEPRPPRHVLLPLDATPEAEAAIPAALDLVEREGRATLLHVVQPSRVVGGHVFNLDETSLARAVSAALDQLSAALERCRSRVRHATLDVVVERDLAEAILSAATRADADTIAVTTRARGGLSRMLFGSVTDKVLRSATLPVLVVPPAE